jgi:hypothetical protein
MDRDRQIELIGSAEERTAGYLRNWMKDPAFRAAASAPNPDRPRAQDARTVLRKKAYA